MVKKMWKNVPNGQNLVRKWSKIAKEILKTYRPVFVMTISVPNWWKSLHSWKFSSSTHGLSGPSSSPLSIFLSSTGSIFPGPEPRSGLFIPDAMWALAPKPGFSIDPPLMPRRAFNWDWNSWLLNWGFSWLK